MIIPDYTLRKSYLDRIRPFIGTNLIKVLIGQRRVGKSYLLFQLMDEVRALHSNAHLMYINKEDLRFSDVKNESDLIAWVNQNRVEGVYNALFIDEVQEIENFHLALRSLLLDQNLDIFITGSNAQLFSADLAGYLGGRYIEFTVFSLSYTEFLDFHKLDDSVDSLHFFMKYGGLPYLKHLPLQDEIVYEYLQSIYNSIVYKDIIQRYGIRNSRFLEVLVLFLAEHTGSLFSAKKISDYLKSQKIQINPAQVLQYVDYLCSAFLILRVPRYDIPGKKQFEFGEKLFFENTGIRNAILAYRPQDLAKIMENVVNHHLRFCGFEVKVGVNNGREIDFVAVRNGETHYFQVALQILEEKTMLREFGNLNQISDHFQKTVISFDSFSTNTMNGIRHIGLREFLNKVDG